MPAHLAALFPTTPELVEAIPVILSLIIIEGLLSVDNALAIAAMASHLPGRQKYLALKYGIIGAYVFRGLCLAFAAWIIENPWLKICGAAYLIYLMAEHFTGAGDENNDSKPDAPNQRGFIQTIVAIEIMDLSLSVDNVVAAVALHPELWVVCTGVFIGILALRLVAGACIKLIEQFPVLAHTAFVLIGYVGIILAVELLSNPVTGFQILPGPVHFGTTGKFIGIVVILGVSILYSRVGPVRRALTPLLRLSLTPMKVFATIVGLALKVLLLPVTLFIVLFKRRKPVVNPQIS